MVEYGGGISNGPAGQVGGSGGGSELGQPVDFFASVGNTINDAANAVASQPPEILALVIILVFAGIVILKRAF